MPPAVSIRQLTKRYGALTAVKELNLDAAEGEILGFLGLNGAGKTTTIRILLDLLRPTTGRAFIFNHDCQRDGLNARSEIGYLPGEMGIYSNMTGSETLDFLAGLNRQAIDKTRGKAWRRELQDRFELPAADIRRKLRDYSTGMKRKLGIIQAFQSDPKLLILDEPTEGLDPLMQEAFYQLLADVKKRGRTVFMSSHVLSEVERVCDRIALLRRGELVLLSTVDEARHLSARRVRVHFKTEVALEPGLPSGCNILERAPRLWTLKVEGALGPLLNAVASLPVDDLEVQEARLEDVIMKYYREGAP